MTYTAQFSIEPQTVAVGVGVMIGSIYIIWFCSIKEEDMKESKANFVVIIDWIELMLLTELMKELVS